MDTRAIAERVAYFRPLRFFADTTSTPAQLAGELVDRDDPWCGPLSRYEVDPDEPTCFSDLAVLKHDASRVWRLESWETLFDRETKKKGYAYCADYGDVAAHLAPLCAHAFQLAGDAAGKRGAMTVRFGGRKHTIRFRTDLHVLSADFLAKVNEVVAPSGHEFVLVSSRFCTGYVLLLSAEEKARLRTERGWEYWPLE